ncbi:MAG TPA: four helix bundle protein [Mucilaginibacter sp.]|jgi:four helix bundle protein|nr:four helix bundle protein [Mucilaginibacter sp.]
MSNRIEDLEVYLLAEKVGDQIWSIVMEWQYFVRDGFGKQLTNAADSVSANITEGFGRYHYKENKNFCYFSRGSIIETKGWLRKAKNRALISENQYSELMSQLEIIHLKLNIYIKAIGKKITNNRSSQEMTQ